MTFAYKPKGGFCMFIRLPQMVCLHNVNLIRYYVCCVEIESREHIANNSGELAAMF